MRMKPTGIEVAFVCVLAMFATTLALLFAFQQKAHSLQKSLYVQCQQRQIFDRSSQNARAQFRAYYVRQIDQEQSNRFIDDKLRAERVHAARVLIDALDDTLSKTPAPGCWQYRP